MNCSKCGKEISDDSNFCYNCGSKIEEQEKSSQIEDAPSSFIDIETYQDTKETAQNTGEINVPEHIPTFESELQPVKQPKKWGRGWFILFMLYSMQFNPAFQKTKSYTTEPNAFISVLPFIGFILLLVIYFLSRHWLIKNKKFSNHPMVPGFIAGIISLFVTSFLVGILTGVAGAGDKRRAETQQAQMAAKDLSASIKDYANSIDGKEPSTSSKGHAPSSYGKLQPIMDWLNNHISTAKNDYTEFNKALEEEHIETILAPETLSNRDRIIEAKSKLQRINLLYDEYEKQIEKRMNEARIQISKLETADYFKKEFLAGFNKGEKEKNELLKEFFRIERTSLTETDNLLNFLLTRSGKYRFENGKMIFYARSDLGRYNKFMQKINNLVKEESTLSDKYREALLSKAQKLDTLSQTLEKDINK